jgi:mannosyl-3-phosphoglycerate phosphatase
MLPPRIVLFTPASLVVSPRSGTSPVSQALAEIDRRNIPLVLSTTGTRAQLELLRRKIGHVHPFITESGGGLFIPDDYFALRLDGAKRAGRYLCLSFGRSSDEAGEVLQDIAGATGTEVVRYAETSAREISRNSGISEREAEASREREFGESFYFAGNADSAAAAFEKMAKERGWHVRRSGPWWDLYSGNDENNAARRLMQLYRRALRFRVKSVCIGTSAEDLRLLKASDQAFILPEPDGQFDQELISKLQRANRAAMPGSIGWNETVLSILSRI